MDEKYILLLLQYMYVFEVDGYDERSTPPPWWLMWFYFTTFFFTTSFCLSNWQVRNRLESSLEVVGGEKSHSCLVTGGEYVQATCYTLDVNRSLQNWLQYETYKLCNLRAEQYEETASYYHPPGRWPWLERGLLEQSSLPHSQPWGEVLLYLILKK